MKKGRFLFIVILAMGLVMAGCATGTNGAASRGGGAAASGGSETLPDGIVWAGEKLRSLFPKALRLT